MIALQALPLWLPRTATWLFHQVKSLPSEITNHIWCQEVANLDQFAIDNIHCLKDAALPRYLWDVSLRKMRLRRQAGHLTATGKKVGAELVHSHWGDYAWRDLPAINPLSVPWLVTFYGKDVNFVVQKEPWPARYRELFDAVDAVLCEGPHMAKCIERLGCPPGKLVVHHLGIDLDRIPFRPRSWRHGEPLKVLAAASFREKKGFPDAIRAVSRTREATGLDIKLTIVGDSSDDPRSKVEKKRILEAIEESDDGSVELLGYQPHEVLMRLAYEHHIFMAPSLTAEDGDTEGGAPVVLIEMAASGMPVVSTTHCDIPEVLTDGAEGLLAAERDVPGLTDRLLSLISDPELWVTLPRSARDHIEAEFDATRQGNRLAGIYADLVARS